MHVLLNPDHPRFFYFFSCAAAVRPYGALPVPSPFVDIGAELLCAFFHAPPNGTNRRSKPVRANNCGTNKKSVCIVYIEFS